jgi:hypothetical protein
VVKKRRRARWALAARALGARGARAGRSRRARWALAALALGARGARAGRSRRARWALAALALVIAVDALAIEPRWPERTHQRIVVPLASPLRVLHLTDLHGTGMGTNERAVLRAIVLTGGTVDRGAFAP